MIIYVDLVFCLNIVLDFILLMSVSVVLKRNIKIKRIIFGSLLGGVTTLVLFINVNSLFLFLIKIFLGFLMTIVTFGYHSFKYTLNNFFYLSTISFSVGGVLYLFIDQKIYNYFLLLLLFSIVCYLYIKQFKQNESNYTNYYRVKISLKNKEYYLTGYLDTGNKLYDNYKHRPVILIDLKIQYDLQDIIYVSYVSLNAERIIKCLRPEKIIIGNKEFKNYLIGLSDKKFKIDGVNCILHSKMKGEL